MTLILTIATLAVLTFLGLSCRRARLDLEERLCECLQPPVAAAAGYRPSRVEVVPTHPVLTGIDGGRGATAPSARRHRRRPPLRVVEGR